MEMVTKNPWAVDKNQPYSTWHSLCSYLGAFPPSIANFFINKFTDEGDNVLDPFSGRGTTLLEGRVLKRFVIASDLNPIALALTNAKNVTINLKQINERINQLEERFDISLYLPEAKAQSENIHLIFHQKTLAQLCYLKRKLLKSESDVDQFLVGCTLGIMHGGERKDGSSGYASISMPNTFSMSPDYVRKFVQTNNLNRDFRDVFELLRRKSERTLKGDGAALPKGLVLKQDVKKLSENSDIKEYQGTVKLVLTSPPYLGVVNYAKQNWIRTWFLDEDADIISAHLDDDLNLNEWINFSKEFVSQAKKFLAPEGVCVLVIGDVAKSKTSIVPLAREFALMIKGNKIFKNIWVISDKLTSTDKTTRIWGQTKGNATATDRIVIMSDIDPFANSVISDDFFNREFLEDETRKFI